MDIGDLLADDGVVLRSGASSKRQALHTVAEAGAQALGLPEARVMEALLEREALGSTGLGSGVAVPHARIEGIDRVTATPDPSPVEPRASRSSKASMTRASGRPSAWAPASATVCSAWRFDDAPLRRTTPSSASKSPMSIRHSRLYPIIPDGRAPCRRPASLWEVL